MSITLTTHRRLFLSLPSRLFLLAVGFSLLTFALLSTITDARVAHQNAFLEPLSTFRLQGPARSVFVREHFAYIAYESSVQGEDASSVQILDISDPTAPVALGVTDPHMPGRPGTLQVVGAYAYLSFWRNQQTSGLHIIDVSNPRDPMFMTTHTLSESVVDVAVAEGRAYVVQRDALRILDVTQPTMPTELGIYRTSGSPRLSDIQVVNDMAYLALAGNGFQILDVHDPGTPSLLGTYPITNLDGASAGDLFVTTNQHVYVASFSASVRGGYIHIVDAHNPSAPARIDSISGPFEEVVAVNDMLVYAVAPFGSFAAGLHLIDMRNPDDPEFDWVTGKLQGIEVIGELLCYIQENESHIARLRQGIAEPDPSALPARCFEETGHCIDGRIRDYWEQNGGLAVFGYPIAAQQELMIEGQPIQAQWFERNRLELHPDNAPPYDVLLGRLGVDVLTQQGRDWQTFPTEAPQNTCRHFEATQQNVCGDILTRWQADGLDLGDPGISEAESLALFGLPISPLQEEVIDGQRYQVQWFERARFELHPENAPPFDVLLGRLGAAGHQMAHVPLQLAVSGRIDGNDDIYLINTNGSDPVRLTTHPETDYTPVWSPDGTRIAFLSTRNEGTYNDIYVMDADGSNPVQLTDGPASERYPAWSPDNTRIAFISNRRWNGRGWYLYTMNADGTDLVRLADELGGVSSPTWSPDGTRIAFWEGNVSNGVVYVINADGSGLQRLADGLRPRWSPDGSRLVFHTPLPDDSTNTLVTINADGSDPVSVITAQDILTPAWSPSQV